MSELFSFVRWFRERGDWTAGQRAKLEQLADTFSRLGLNVDVVFGKTDVGDPWCVLKGDDEEVLVHVARVGDHFVVHSLLEGVIEEAVDLDTLLRAHLDAGAEDDLRPQGDVVLPFELRRAQTLIALAVAAGAFEAAAPSRAAAAPQPAASQPAETPQAVHDPTPDIHAAPPATVNPPGSPAHEAQSAPRSATSIPHAEAPPAHAPELTPPTVLTTTPHAPPPPPDSAGPAQSLTPLHAPRIAPDLQGTAGADSLVGSARAEWIVGGAGNDTLVGGGGADTLQGGDGDDRLEFTDGALVLGGRGADTFVVEAPTHARPNQLLGVILDFSSAEGDRVITSRGRLLKLKPSPRGDDGGASAPSSSNHHASAHAADVHRTVTRVDVDIDDDGVSDGYLLVITRSSADPSALAAPGVQVLGRDPGQPSELMLDVTGDGLVDGRLSIDVDGGPALLVVGHSLFSSDPGSGIS